MSSALLRFTNRRGVHSRILSDHGSNFVALRRFLMGGRFCYQMGLYSSGETLQTTFTDVERVVNKRLLLDLERGNLIRTFVAKPKSYRFITPNFILWNLPWKICKFKADNIGHRLRIGGANWAFQNGWDEMRTKRRGRWYSIAFLKYIRCTEQCSNLIFSELTIRSCSQEVQSVSRDSVVLIACELGLSTFASQHNTSDENGKCNVWCLIF